MKALKKEGRRLKQASVRKTKGWSTYSALIHFHSLGDTVGLKYEPEKPYYRDIMRDLKEAQLPEGSSGIKRLARKPGKLGRGFPRGGLHSGETSDRPSGKYTRIKAQAGDSAKQQFKAASSAMRDMGRPDAQKRAAAFAAKKVRHKGRPGKLPEGSGGALRLDRKFAALKKKGDKGAAKAAADRYDDKRNDGLQRAMRMKEAIAEYRAAKETGHFPFDEGGLPPSEFFAKKGKTPWGAKAKKGKGKKKVDEKGERPYDYLAHKDKTPWGTTPLKKSGKQAPPETSRQWRKRAKEQGHYKDSAKKFGRGGSGKKSGEKSAFDMSRDELKKWAGKLKGKK